MSFSSKMQRDARFIEVVGLKSEAVFIALSLATLNGHCPLVDLLTQNVIFIQHSADQLIYRTTLTPPHHLVLTLMQCRDLTVTPMLGSCHF